MPTDLINTFSSIKDTRVERNKKHSLIDIIVLTICAIISGADGWEDIHEFGKDKLDWLRQFIDLAHGVPSDDTIARVISSIDPEQMQACFARWAQGVSNAIEGDTVGIDGKTLRGSYQDGDKRSAIHMVSAWASKAGLSLGQVKTNEKSNEITAIPELLELLEIKGCIVTIDAMGCQTDIAEQIVNENKADYVLAVKDNQKSLHEAITDYFDTALSLDASRLDKAIIDFCEETDSGHGRIECRRCYLSTCLDTLPDAARWKGLKSIVMIESERLVDGRQSIERRHYISTLTDVKAVANAIRSHWSIENSLHWVLDVTFGEDDNLIHRGDSAQNLNVFRQIGINLLKKEGSRLSLNKKRFKAALNDSFREKIIFSA